MGFLKKWLDKWQSYSEETKTIRKEIEDFLAAKNLSSMHVPSAMVNEARNMKRLKRRYEIELSGFYFIGCFHVGEEEEDYFREEPGPASAAYEDSVTRKMTKVVAVYAFLKEV